MSVIHTATASISSYRVSRRDQNLYKARCSSNYEKCPIQHACNAVRSCHQPVMTWTMMSTTRVLTKMMRH